MLKKIIEIYKSVNKYFFFAFVTFFLFIIIGLISPQISSVKEKNWHINLESKTNSLVDLINNKFNEIQNKTISYNLLIKEKIKPLLLQKELNKEEIFKILNQFDDKHFSVALFNPRLRIIGWNSNYSIRDDYIYSSIGFFGNTRFLKSDLNEYLVYTDTIKVDEYTYYILTAQLLENYFRLNKNNFEIYSFTEQLSQLTNTEVEINYLPTIAKTKDGRKFSFDLNNNNGEKIGLVTIMKPLLKSEIQEYKNITSQFQAFLILLMLLMLFMGLYSDVKKIKNKFLRIVLVIFFAGLVRAIIFWFKIPHIILPDHFFDATQFSSTWGGGIVNSPAEFLITSLFFFGAVYYFFNEFGINNNSDKNHIPNKSSFIIKTILFITVVIVTLRILSAAAKSVIFDSTLRYFNQTEIIPHSPHIIMHLAVLLFSVSIFLLLYTLFRNTIHQLINYKKNNFKLLLLYFIIGAFVISALYQIVNTEPLIPFSISLTGVILSLLVCGIDSFFVINKKQVIIVSAVTASIFSISALNYFNANLEKESIKRTAIELNRPNDVFLNFIVRESLINASSNEFLSSSFFERNVNYNASAFSFWSNSPLYDPSFYSSITILDKNRKFLGSFSYGIKGNEILPQYFSAGIFNELTIFPSTDTTNNLRKTITGITPIKRDVKIVGYAVIVVAYEKSLFNEYAEGKFLFTNINTLNDVVDPGNLNLFLIEENNVSLVQSSFYPNKEQLAQIIYSDYGQTNELWLNFIVENESYIVYSLKQSGDKPNFTVVMLKEKEIAWKLFNFVKLFLLHSIFILIYLFISLLFNLKKLSQFRYTFRVQLLTAFLIVSIIPLIAIAIYNRQNVVEKTNNLIKTTLVSKTKNIINHISIQIQNNPDREIRTAFKKANQELGISFDVYAGEKLYFSSTVELFNSGVFNSLINPDVYILSYEKGFNEIYNSNNLGNLNYNSFYKKFNLGNEEYLIEVNNLLNSIPTTYSTIEVDIFLFGIYTIAVILIIISSTFLSNRISSPIRKLTKATQAVASGDLNIIIENKDKGEISDLISGFNQMTQDLKQHQENIAELERESAWKEMARQVAHEIKNPLTPMKLMVQQLITSFKDKNEKFETIFDKVSTTLLNQIDTLSNIASEFSRFARMPSFHSSQFDLVILCKEVITLFNSENVKFIFESTNETIPINSDMFQFRSLFINMIRNSIQADANEIKIKLELTGENIIIFIEDNGKGISPEIQKNIFDKSFTTKRSGMGIGLKLIKRFVDISEGEISLLSSVEGKTIFKITFPVFVNK